MQPYALIHIALLFLTATSLGAQGTRGIQSGTRPAPFVLRIATEVRASNAFSVPRTSGGVGDLLRTTARARTTSCHPLHPLDGASGRAAARDGAWMAVGGKCRKTLG